MSLEQQIDALYQRPLSEFVAARTALARELGKLDKDAARRVKALAKPAVVAWAANQIYWQARDRFDAVIDSGRKLRAAQIAALSGKKTADIRQATERHHQAIAAAVDAGQRIAAAHGAHPDADALARTLDALSLSTQDRERPGRLTRPLAPAGFEALAGVDVKPPAPRRPDAATSAPAPAHRQAGHSGKSQQPSRDSAAARAEAAAARRQEAAIRRAEQELAAAQDAETRAREAWQRARDRLAEAQRAVADATGARQS